MLLYISPFFHMFASLLTGYYMVDKILNSFSIFIIYYTIFIIYYTIYSYYILYNFKTIFLYVGTSQTLVDLPFHCMYSTTQ